MQFGEYGLASVERFAVDPNYQREVATKHVKTITEDFDPDIFGALLVNYRQGDDYRLWVYDGQHRLVAAKQLGISEVPYIVTNGGHPRTVGEEARKFQKLNFNRKSVTPWNRYRALRVDGDPMMIALDRAVANVGWKVGPKADGNTVPVPPLIAIYKKSQEDGLAQVLTLARDLWADDPRATDQAVLKGLHLFWLERGETIDVEAFQRKLGVIEPREILRRAKELRADVGGTVPTNVKRVILKIYRARKSEAV